MNFDNHARQLAQQYLLLLASADYHGLIQLFAPAAMVHSPLYGQLPAADFYPRLLADTTASHLELHDVLTHPAARSLAIYFDYQWEMANGNQASFPVMDWLQLDAEGHILTLHIIYDTQATRTAWQG